MFSSHSLAYSLAFRLSSLIPSLSAFFFYFCPWRGSQGYVLQSLCVCVCVCVCVYVYSSLSPGTVTWTSFSPDTRTLPLYSELKRHKQTLASLEFAFTGCRVVIVCAICIWELVVNSIVCGFVSFPSLMRPHGSAVIAVCSRPVTRVQNQPCLV